MNKKRDSAVIAYIHFKDFLSRYGTNKNIMFIGSHVESILVHLVDKYKNNPLTLERITRYNDKGIMFTPNEVRDIIWFYEQKIEINLNKRAIAAIRRLGV